MPELPDARAERIAKTYDLNEQEIAVLIEDRAVAAYFEEAAQIKGADPKQVGNWVTGEIFRRLNEEDVSIDDAKVNPAALVELLGLVQQGTINQNAAREIFTELWKKGGSPAAIVEARGLKQISDTEQLEDALAQVIEENPDAIEKIRGGNLKTVQFLMGQVMKITRGKANPQLVQDLIRKELGV